MMNLRVLSKEQTDTYRRRLAVLVPMRRHDHRVSLEFLPLSFSPIWYPYSCCFDGHPLNNQFRLRIYIYVLASQFKLGSLASAPAASSYDGGEYIAGDRSEQCDRFIRLLDYIQHTNSLLWLDSVKGNPWCDCFCSSVLRHKLYILYIWSQLRWRVLFAGNRMNRRHFKVDSLCSLWSCLDLSNAICMALEWTEWWIEEKEWNFLPRSCRLSLVPENLLMLEEERNLPVGEAPENQQGFSQRPTKAMSWSYNLQVCDAYLFGTHVSVLWIFPPFFLALLSSVL